ncbi:MAG: type II toxin-antitoxin system RelE/ParE family toxin [Balneola sp.]|nr:type II toxin-antitoxin system RelE/ParE family toxin [Balneola sp.]
MNSKIKSYELSLAADSDIEKIFDYIDQEFGFDQALKYITELDTIFTDLVKSPELGRKRDEIKFGLISIVQESHVIFYRVLEDRIRIIRILHVSRDIKNFL